MALLNQVGIKQPHDWDSQVPQATLKKPNVDDSVYVAVMSNLAQAVINLETAITELSIRLTPVRALPAAVNPGKDRYTADESDSQVIRDIVGLVNFVNELEVRVAGITAELQI